MGQKTSSTKLKLSRETLRLLKTPPEMRPIGWVCTYGDTTCRNARSLDCCPVA